MTNTLRALRRLLGRTAGQAMVEYSLIASSLFFVAAPITVLGIWPRFLSAFSGYVHGYFWLLNSPFP